MPGRLMCVVAHPDDECYAFGGALALASQKGWEVSIVCLTDGQAATNRGTSLDGQDLGRMRREEFSRACAVLKAAHHELMDYQDGQLEFATISDASRKIVARMRQFRPHIVITFGLDGGLNVHPDHMMVSCITSTAFRWSAREKRYPELGLEPYAPQRLFHVSSDYKLPDREPLLPAPWSIKLDIRSVLSVKEAAFREHTSQLPVYEKVKPFWDQYGNAEYYTLAGTSDPQPMKLSDDLFEGIDLSR